MNTSVTSSRRKHGISRWMPVLLAASFCLTVAISAQAVVIDWDYDGSYYPTDDPPPTGQSTWSVTRTGTPDVLPNTPGAGVASFLDDQTDARLQMSNAFTESTFVSQPENVEWECSFVMSFTGWQGIGGTPTQQAVVFGVRDEGGSGKFVMFSHSKDGTKLFYANSIGTQHGSDIWTGDALTAATGEYAYHTYEVRKYLDTSDVMQVAFYLDGNLEDTRAYSGFVNDSSTTNGFGIFGNTPGTSDYLVDNAHFGIIPEPTTAALLVGLLVVPLLWRRKKNVL